VEKDLDEEAKHVGQVAQTAETGTASGKAVDNLEFLREVDEHAAMLAENMRRAELLAHKLHEDAAKRRRQARERAKDALLAAASAEAAAANNQIDKLKLEVALRLSARSRPASAAVQGVGEQQEESRGAAVEED
jgi:hypothetical protein